MKSTLRKQLSAFAQRRLQIERRGNKRIVPVHRTLCQIQPCGHGERTTALVHNISCTGLAIQAKHACAPGTRLRLLLVNEAHTFSLTMELIVVRSIRSSDQYVIAGEFSRPLLHEEVAPFIL